MDSILLSLSGYNQRRTRTKNENNEIQFAGKISRNSRSEMPGLEVRPADDSLFNAIFFLQEGVRETVGGSSSFTPRTLYYTVLTLFLSFSLSLLHLVLPISLPLSLSLFFSLSASGHTRFYELAPAILSESKRI